MGITIRLYDKSFVGLCMNTVGQEPKYFSWRREGEPDRVAWFTDSCLEEAPKVKADVKVAWILEAPCMRTGPYDFIDAHPGYFTHTVCLDTQAPEWRASDPNHIICLAHGCRLRPDDRKVYVKDRLVSIIASPKREMAGYDLRHELIEAEGKNLDAYGEWYKQLPGGYKLDALAPYMFTVVITQAKGLASEAITDAFLSGTVPIVWGQSFNPNIYDARGCIQCEDMKDLRKAIRNATEAEYKIRLRYARKNFRTAMRIACPEDWLFEQYPYLFGV